MAKRTAHFQTHPHLQRRWKQMGRKLAYPGGTSTELARWRRAATRKLRQLTGYDSMQAADLRPRVTGEVDCGDYRRQRVEIQTEPGVVMPCYVLIPKNIDGPRPAVLAPHGHGGGGKVSVAGIRETPEVTAAIEGYNYAYGLQFVRAGFVTFCPDARGFGERQEQAALGNPLGSSCQVLNNMGLPLGQTVTGMWAWDLHRLIDYVQTRDDCQADRIGCAGLSGGGLQTLWATALNRRIRCAVVSGYMYGYKQSLLDMHTNCSCNFVPHLYEHLDMGDIAALIAPRPLLIETGTRDSLNGAGGLANVRSQLRIIRRAYRDADAQGLVKHDIFEGNHRWNGIQAIPWMQKHLDSRVQTRGRCHK